MQNKNLLQDTLKIISFQDAVQKCPYTDEFTHKDRLGHTLAADHVYV